MLEQDRVSRNTPHGKQLHREAAMRWIDRNKQKRAAHITLNNAIARKKVESVRACKCVQCGQQAQEYHHADYSKPLDVIPVCTLCHNAIHANLSCVSVAKSPLVAHG